MDLCEVPTFVALKLALLSDASAAAANRADVLTAQISDVRDRLNSRVVREGDDPATLRMQFEQLLAEQKALQKQRPVETSVIESCKAWLAALPAGTVLEQVAPVVEDGLSLTAVRARIKGLQGSVAVLKHVPVPAPDIKEKIRNYVEALTRPVIGGINVGEALTVRWPTEPHVLMAFLQPEVLVDRLMVGINQISNSPCGLPERKQRIAELEQQIDRLQRVEEAVVVATGAPRERGCPPWVVLCVKAVEVRGVRAA